MERKVQGGDSDSEETKLPQGLPSSQVSNDDGDPAIVGQAVPGASNELSDDERMQLFDKGVEFKSHGSNRHALLCFLGCLRDLKPSSVFNAMPVCLKNIADIYAEQDDYEKAIPFVQAVKLYYETAIVNYGTRNQCNDNIVLDSQDQEEEYKTLDENAQSQLALRANEYEKLSNSCLKDKNLQLALEYCGKATQLRRGLYGDNHPITVKSLDIFTVIYAEIGKQQYADAVDKFKSSAINTSLPTPESENKEIPSQGSKTSCLKGNKVTRVKSVRFAGLQSDDEDEHSSVEHDDEVMYTSSTNVISKNDKNDVGSLPIKQIFIFVLISVTIAVLFTYTWCYYFASPMCPRYSLFKNVFKYLYYAYVHTWFSDEKYV